MSLRRYALCPLSSSFPELRNAVRTLRYASAFYVAPIHLASVCNVYRGEIIHVGCKTSACIITHLCHHLRAVGSMCISAVNYDLRTLLALAYKCMQCTEFVVVIDRDCKISHAYIPINDRGGIQDLMFWDAHTLEFQTCDRRRRERHKVCPVACFRGKIKKITWKGARERKKHLSYDVRREGGGDLSPSPGSALAGDVDNVNDV